MLPPDTKPFLGQQVTGGTELLEEHESPKGKNPAARTHDQEKITVEGTVYDSSCVYEGHAATASVEGSDLSDLEN